MQPLIVAVVLCSPGVLDFDAEQPGGGRPAVPPNPLIATDAFGPNGELAVTVAETLTGEEGSKMHKSLRKLQRFGSFLKLPVIVGGSVRVPLTEAAPHENENVTLPPVYVSDVNDTI